MSRISSGAVIQLQGFHLMWSIAFIEFKKTQLWLSFGIVVYLCKVDHVGLCLRTYGFQEV